MVDITIVYGRYKYSYNMKFIAQVDGIWTADNIADHGKHSYNTYPDHEI